LFGKVTGLVEVRLAVGNEFKDNGLKLLLKLVSFDTDKLVLAAELHPDELFVEWFLISKFLNSVTSEFSFLIAALLNVSGPFDFR